MSSFGYLQRRGRTREGHRRKGHKTKRGRGMGQKGEGHRRKEGRHGKKGGGYGWDMKGEVV